MHGVGQEALIDRAMVHLHALARRVPCTEVERLVGVILVELALVQKLTDLLQPIDTREGVRQAPETEAPPPPICGCPLGSYGSAP